MNSFVHDPEWGWWIILYFYLGGLAAGCYFIATLIELFGREEDRPLARIGYRVAFPLICVCAVFLIVDLYRPERFLHMVLQSEHLPGVMLKWWSPMSIGAQALGIFGLCSLLSLVGTFRPKGRLASILDSHVVGRVFKVVGSIAGFFVAAYTGALLSATNQPLWSSTDWISPLFLTSAASGGIALLLILGGRASAETRERLERADLWALGLELFVFLIFLASLGGVLPLALGTQDGLLLVGGTLVVGLVLPLALHLRIGSVETEIPTHRRQSLRVLAAALFTLAGGFMLRYGIVRVAPALLHAHSDVRPGDTETSLWQSVEGKVLLAGTILLAVLIPLILKRNWGLTLRQATLVGMVSVLFTAAVAAYVMRPAGAEPMLDPLSGLNISPEDGRERGGGAGASNINRPHQPLLRSKLNPADEP